MDIKTIMESPGLWAVSALMVIVTVSQAIVFYLAGKKEANRLKIPHEIQSESMRSAIITTIGPAFAAVIVLVSMITVVGAPTTWMRLNVIGAARTELAMTNIAADFLGVSTSGADFGIKAFTLALWAMALNDLGWLLGTLIFTPNMGNALGYMNTHFDAKWVKMLMSGTILGIFGYLLLNACWNKKEKTPCYVVSAIVAAIADLLISRLFAKNKRMQELGLGISMLLGMFAAAFVQYNIIK